MYKAAWSKAQSSPSCEGRIPEEWVFVAGRPRPSLTWWHNNTILDSVVDSSTSSLTTVNQLDIKSVPRSYRGDRLECRATSSEMAADIVREVPLIVYRTLQAFFCTPCRTRAISLACLLIFISSHLSECALFEYTERMCVFHTLCLITVLFTSTNGNVYCNVCTKRFHREIKQWWIYVYSICWSFQLNIIFDVIRFSMWWCFTVNSSVDICFNNVYVPICKYLGRLELVFRCCFTVGSCYMYAFWEYTRMCYV